ncbi:hypothetical protein [Sphingobium sp.]|uniref:hypothetical protein n=1 Tax=Sphingobium sp. TaxID=1912891 RepID=UPI002C1A08FB|nr:hypothetical protein [Sphingobium sp.]HUD89959.1 hypothetical protein [Sphingobium sp.]
MSSRTIIIRGSYGNLTVERATGNVVLYDPARCSINGVIHVDDDYKDIVRFDPATLPDVSECDILGTGFWDDKGRYEPAMVWSAEAERWVDA